MQYSPKLKKAMQQIKDILSKHDIAGIVILYEPQHSEHLIKVDPTWSCAKLDPVKGILRMKAKKEDYSGKVELRNKAINDTTNMIVHFTDQLAMRFSDMSGVQQMIEQAVGIIEKGESSESSHQSQNN